MAFFEIAATLIPILLFGGVVADRLRPSVYEPHSRVSRYAFWIPAFGSYAIVAEVTAIVAIVSGDSDWWSRLLVSAFLTLGMVSIIITLWRPWVDELHKRDPKRARRIRQVSIALLVLAFLGSVRVMSVGVSAGEEIARIDAYLENLERGNSAQASGLNQGLFLAVTSARAQQQRIAAEAKHEPAVVVASLRRLERLLLSLAVGSVKWQDHLLLKNANLYREMQGLPKLRELPLKGRTPAHPQSDHDKEQDAAE